jgi:DNA-binding CsgD family transcriptional regulator
MPKSHRSKKRAAKKEQAIVLATPEGKIQFADATARRWLKKFFGRPTRPGLLPRKICRWLAGSEQTGRGVSAVVKRQNTRLVVVKQKASTAQSTLLLLELIKGKGDERSRRHRSLTPREREVLLWLTRGKSNSQIAQILGMKPSTVSKHLERIYPKLGVENRTAAANFNLQDRQLTS